MSETGESLSEREAEILRLVATGAANKEIARQLAISPNTVKVHLRNIFAKIGVSSRTEATLYAVQSGLIRPSAVNDALDEVPAAEPGVPVLASGEAENLALAPTTAEASREFPPGAPAAEPNGSTVSPLDRPRQRGLALKAWQIGILIIGALMLIASGVIASRLLPSAATATPVIASPAAGQVLTLRRWSELPKLPSARKGMGIVEYDNSFYLVAGAAARGPDGGAFRYDPARNTWKSLAAMPGPYVTDIQAALVGEKIYVPGGRTADGKDSDRLAVYDPRRNKWDTESASRLPVPISGYAMVSFEGQLYLFGGKSGSQYLSSVYIYDPKENKWTSRISMSIPRAYAGATESGGKIYVIGGYDGQHALNLNEVYIPARDGTGDTPWESFAPLPQGRFGMGITHLANLIYIVGGSGENNGPVKPQSLQYVLQSDQWMEFDSPPALVGNSPALLASGSFLYSFGGETQQGLSTASLSYQAIYTVTAPYLRNDPTP